MSQEQQEQALQNSEPQSVDVTVNVGGDSRAERFLGTFDQISRLSLDIDRNYGKKRVLTDFPLEHDGTKWTGTINKLIVGFVASQDSDLGFFSINSQSTFLENENDPSNSSFMNIGNLIKEDFKDEQKYKFKLIWDGGPFGELGVN